MLASPQSQLALIPPMCSQALLTHAVGPGHFPLHSQVCGVFFVGGDRGCRVVPTVLDLGEGSASLQVAPSLLDAQKHPFNSEKVPLLLLGQTAPPWLLGLQGGEHTRRRGTTPYLHTKRRVK